MSKRSVEAKLARNVLVGDLKEFFFITVRMIRQFPPTPSTKVNLRDNIRVLQTTSSHN